PGNAGKRHRFVCGGPGPAAELVRAHAQPCGAGAGPKRRVRRAALRAGQRGRLYRLCYRRLRDRLRDRQGGYEGLLCPTAGQDGKAQFDAVAVIRAWIVPKSTPPCKIAYIPRQPRWRPASSRMEGLSGMKTLIGLVGACLLLPTAAVYGADDWDKVLQQQIDLMNEMTSILKTVKDKDTSKAAVTKLKKLKEKFMAVAKKKKKIKKTTKKKQEEMKKKKKP